MALLGGSLRWNRQKEKEMKKFKAEVGGGKIRVEGGGWMGSVGGGWISGGGGGEN